MRNCDDCQQWAQWLVRTPIKIIDPKDPEKTKTKIVGWQHVAYLCGQHKKSMESAPSELDLHFAFIGAVPSGFNHPK